MCTRLTFWKLEKLSKLKDLVDRTDTDDPEETEDTPEIMLNHKLENRNNCFVHPIFSSFGFWYFGHFSCVIFFPIFFRLAHLALQNVNKDYTIFLYFRNFIAK